MSESFVNLALTVCELYKKMEGGGANLPPLRANRVKKFTPNPKTKSCMNLQTLIEFTHTHNLFIHQNMRLNHLGL